MHFVAFGGEFLKKTIERAYVEIGNICNLKCSFCPGTKRAPRRMSAQEFNHVAQNLFGVAQQLYLHVMGEPLLHPELSEILDVAGTLGFKVSITTNGTLLDRCRDVLMEHSETIHKVSISLHAHEANGINLSVDQYLNSVISFAKEFALRDKNVVFRLWNLDTAERQGKNSENTEILEKLHTEYPEEWQKRYSGYRLSYRTFLELDGIFTWPVESEELPNDTGRCHGLIQQIGILADGTVVPCCLDSEGSIALGNIFEQPITQILSSPLAAAMKEGFKSGRMVHPVCKTCSYARRFSDSSDGR